MATKSITIVTISSLLAVPLSVHGQIIKALNPLGASIQSTAQAINSGGMVVGYSTNSQSFDLPTLWRPDVGGTYTALALPLPDGFAIGGANAINSAGIVVGYVQPASRATASAVMWSPTGPGGAYVANLLSSPAGMNYNAAFGINAAGTVVGFGGSSTGGSVPVVWSPSTPTVLPPYTTPNPAGDIMAAGINDAGVIVGYGATIQSASFAWTSDGAGGFTRHSVIAADDAAVTGINNNGIGVGVYAGDQAMVLAYFEGDYYAADLPVPNFSSDSASIGINDLDGIVGYAKDPTSPLTGPEAVFWTPTENFWDYVNLDQWFNQHAGSLSLAQHWRLNEATGINDSWLVVGNALFSQFGNADTGGGVSRGYVLDVSSMVPEPAPVSVILPLALLAVRKRSRRR